MVLRMKTPMIAGLFAWHFRQNNRFPGAPITVQIGRLLAQTQNALLRLQNKAVSMELRVVCAFFRLKRWDTDRRIAASPEGTAEADRTLLSRPSGTKAIP